MSIPSIYLRSIRLLGPDLPLSAALAVLGLIIAGLQIAEPILFGRAVDALIRGQPALGLVLVWAGLAVGSIVAGIGIALHADRIAHRRRLSAMRAFFEHVMTLSADFHAEARSGRLMKVMLTGCDHLFSLWLSVLREQLTAFISLLVLFPVAMWMNWRLTILLLVLMVLYAAANGVVMARTQEGQEKVERHASDLAGRAADAFGNVAVVQSFLALPTELRALQATMSGYLAAQYPVLNWWAVMSVLTRGASSLSIVAIFAFGAVLVSRGEATVGEIVSFVGFAGTLIARLDQLSGFVSRLFFQIPALREFFEVFDHASSVDDPPGRPALVVKEGAVRFDDVTFRYPRMGGGVEGISLEAQPGETVAIVGPTGSGKSTTLALLQRVYDPEKGRVLIDGQDIRHVSLESLRRATAVVFQEAGLFNRSIAENIRLGRPEASDEEVIDAAKLAEAHEFIMRKPEGYATLVGERGVGLSGGERQRVAIARALLKDAPILILDEATSALDVHTEQRVQSALAKLRRGRTTFVIAHRLSTVRNADRILVLDRGRVIEQGSYNALAAARGTFARLVAQGGLAEPLIERTASVAG